MTQDQRDNTNFPFELARRLADIKWPVEYDFLYYHQNIARIYVNEPNTRGLLIFHGTGMGKSILAASIAMDVIFPTPSTTSYRHRRIIVLLAKSLAINMINAIEQYIAARKERGGNATLGDFGAIASLPDDKRQEWIRKKFGFVTMNASNMLTQMSRATFISEEDEDLLFDNKARDLSSVVPNLDNSLLIVDEAHNFFRAIINGSANSAGLYESIMSARNLKLIFLSGTPIASHPFEMAVCFNMLAGKQIMPIHYEDFVRIFISPQHTIAHRNKFQNRIFGLVSFVDYNSHPGIGTADIVASMDHSNSIMSSTASTDKVLSKERAKQELEFPKEYPLNVVRVPMSIEQYDAYIMAREREKNEGLSKAMRDGGNSSLENDWETQNVDGSSAAIKSIIAKPRRFFIPETPALNKPKSAFSSSYRVHSRQISNYCPPMEIRKQMTIEKDEIPVSEILNKIGLIHSVKFSAILERVRKHKGQTGIIYSQFVGLGGIAVFAKFLDQNGYQDNYAIISGEVSVDERERIKNMFCATENKYAEKCALLLISSTGAEGLDLKNVRHVHILEPYWHLGRINQIKARAIRHRSHIDLPPEDRNVTTYLYIAVQPKTDKDVKQGELTSDESIYQSSCESQMLNDSFESAIKEVSIECALNHPVSSRGSHCRICAPTNDKLFTENLENDVLDSPDPCHPIISQKIMAKKIKVGDTVFYYREALPNSIESHLYGFEIFIEDPRIHAWRKILPNDTRYGTIAVAIANAEAK